MNKILIVAQSEFSTLVRSKAFIISVILMPIVMGGSIFLVRATKDTVDVKDRTFAYIDHSGVIGLPIEEVAKATNAATDGPNGRTGPRFLPQRVNVEGRNIDDVKLELSQKVKKQELFAFVEFPADIVNPETRSQILYYSDTPSYTALPQWVRATTARIVEVMRFRNAGVDPVLVAKLTKQIPIEQLGLVSRDSSGRVEAKQVDRIRASMVPFAFLMLMYITVMSSAPQLLNSVMEEKMGRISEVLIASVTPFQLMMGKLLGSVAVSVLLAFIYIGGAIGVASYWGYAGVATPSQLAWFALFLLMAVVLFGSLFIAIGSACTDLKDSQNLVTPVMLMVMLPMMTIGPILRAPDGMFATVLSMLPTAAPFLMMLRISMQPGPPLWQVALSVALMLATVVLFAWAAGRIFRTGLLMQGKSASFAEMIRWVRAG
jgi:ABC-2 type transport system permease protein